MTLARRASNPTSSRRASGRVNGSTKKNPKTSVTKPGVSSRVPPTSTSAASASSRLGSWPDVTAPRSALQARAPSRRTIQAPRALSSSSSAHGRQRADLLADLHDHVDLDDRHDQERQDQQPAHRAHLLLSAARPRSRNARSRAPHTVTRQSASRTIVAAHLGRPAHAFHELDRHLDDTEPLLHGAPREVHLEAVARGWRPRPGPASPGSCAGRRGSRRSRRGRPMPQRPPDVAVAALREQPAAQRPVDHRPAGHPARAEHQVGVRQRREQRGQLLRLVRAVGVHLDQHVVVPLEAPAEPREVRRARDPPSPSGAARAPAGRRRRARRPASPVPSGLRVVDDQHVRQRDGSAHPGHDLLDVVRLLVGRHDHQHPGTALDLGGQAAGPAHPGARAPSRAPGRRRRRRDAAAAASSRAPVSSHSGQAPSRVASVLPVAQRHLGDQGRGPPSPGLRPRPTRRRGRPR